MINNKHIINNLAFNNDKKQCLYKMKTIDKSKKGSIDALIKPLLELINSKKDFYTTSSCSGRIIVVALPQNKRKYNTKWLFVSHEEVAVKDIIKHLEAIKSVKDTVYLRFEPIILHIAATSVEKAVELINLASSVGFKRGGIISANKKIIVELVGVDTLDVPIAKDKKLMISEDYLRFIIEEANNKLMRNKERIDLFYEKIKSKI
ncbi:hypothetical protein HY636_01850 [Candidatus Woesearchaeota archaeon]|nr:hypothetical protein [Candidatus Woesearchaeota archaeon]